MTSEPLKEGNNALTYYLKGLDSFSLCKNEEALSWFDRAIEINPYDANYYYGKGLALQCLHKDHEAIVYYNKAVRINPNNRNFHSKKVLTLEKFGRSQDAVDYYDQALESEPENIIFYEYKAFALQRMGRDQEAGVCLRRIEEIKQNKQSKHTFHFNEGLTLKDQGKYEEAILEFDKAIEIDKNSTDSHFYKGLTLISLNKDQDALRCFERAIRIWPKEPLYYCVRARTLRCLNKQKEALIDFKRAQEIDKSGEARSEVKYLTIVVNSIFELQKNDEKTEKIMGQLDKNNLKSMKFVEDLKVFQVRKEKVITDLLAGIEEKSYKEMLQEKIHAVSQLRDDYQRLQKEIKEELSKELDNFYKKFDAQIGDMDLGPDDQTRVKDYFKAFIGTFSFAFEGSQAIENENLQLDIGCLLSTFASFESSCMAYIWDRLGVTSIGKFFSREEIQRNAKKMLELFFDSSVYLNAVLGKAAEKIALDKAKREYILAATESELDYHNRNLFQSVSIFCDQMSESIDINLYKQLYNTPAARLGHMDANELIQEYCEGKIGLERIQEEFVERTLKRQRIINQVEADEIKIKIKEKNKDGKGKCCCIF